MADKDLAFQFSGPYTQALVSAVQQEIDLRDPDIAYLFSLSLASAGPTELATIGGIIGYPWPTSPTGTFSDNNFIFGAAASFPTISGLNGFAGVDSPGVGGLFSSATPSVGNLIPIAFYRLLLAQVAFLKYNGLSMTIIDQICHVFGQNYTIQQAGSVNTWFMLGAAADFPNSSSTHGLAGVTPPFDVEGGKLFGTGFNDSDIIVEFQTQIGAGYLYIIQQLFNRFCTSPQVFVSQG